MIHSLVCRGLQTAGLLSSDDLIETRCFMEATVRPRAGERTAFNPVIRRRMAYLAEQTGGFAVLNSNGLGGEPGRISDDARDTT